MKREILGIMLGCVVLMTACASGKDKAGAAASGVQSEEKQDQSTEDPQINKSQEVMFDPYIPQLNIPDVDPYEKKLFEVFGLDNDFPKPKDSFDQVWNYSTTGGEEIDSKSGDMVQLPVACSLKLELKPQFYEDYVEEIEEYLTVSYAKQSRGIAWNHTDSFSFTALMDNGDFVEGDLRDPLKLIKHLPSGTFELEAEVKSVSSKDFSLYDARDSRKKLGDLSEYPWSIDLETSDGEVIDIGIHSWAESWDNCISYENAKWERLPQTGDKIKVKGFLYDKEFLRFSSMELKDYYNTGSALITEFEFLNN